ncbi:MAG TPA: DUF4190 domain-containing protein [Pyrinomonadaceae bacterium]|jgi:hypothetical protein|nr:DUF4190 domain-containing protein [Pyrinomonadaceae bacterium]
MKRCPRCNQEFADEWLTFCTQDGTSLVSVEARAGEPPPTLFNPPLPPSVSPAEQPTLDLPGRYSPPAEYLPPQPLQSGWAPPPPPAYPIKREQTLAVASLVLGIVSITLGWCCSFGILTSPIAIVLGIVSLFQIKNDPKKYGGKGFALGGIATGALYFVILLLLMLIWGFGILLGGAR